LTFFVLIAADVAAARVFGLGVTALVAGIAAAQWIAYALTLRGFVRRGALKGRGLALSHGAHGALSLCGFGAAAVVAHSVRGTPLVVQTLSEIGVGIALAVTVLLGRTWHPASRVLAHRLGQANFVAAAGPLGRLGFLVPR
jgi:hypothetical protein